MQRGHISTVAVDSISLEAVSRAASPSSWLKTTTAEQLLLLL